MSLPKVEGQAARRITIDFAVKNDVVGWSSLIEPYKHTGSAVCLQKVKALSVNGNKLRWLIKDNPAVGYQVFKGLSEVVTSRLDDTRQVLLSERLLANIA